VVLVAVGGIEHLAGVVERAELDSSRCPDELRLEVQEAVAGGGQLTVVFIVSGDRRRVDGLVRHGIEAVAADVDAGVEDLHAIGPHEHGRIDVVLLRPRAAAVLLDRDLHRGDVRRGVAYMSTAKSCSASSVIPLGGRHVGIFPGPTSGRD
jgi:hypothetical protein